MMYTDSGGGPWTGPAEREDNMRRADVNPNRLTDWGHGLMSKLSSGSRRRIKRQASKKRRVLLRQQTQVAQIQ